jgi:Immunity protein Imm1
MAADAAPATLISAVNLSAPVASVAEPDERLDAPGTRSEFPADAAVRMDDAREAVRRFFATGERPDNIDWRMD